MTFKVHKNYQEGALQEMMNAELDSTRGYSKYDKTTEKQTIEDDIYQIVFIDAVHFSVREENHVVNWKK